MTALAVILALGSWVFCAGATYRYFQAEWPEIAVEDQSLDTRFAIFFASGMTLGGALVSALFWVVSEHPLSLCGYLVGPVTVVFLSRLCKHGWELPGQRRSEVKKSWP